jgi:transposase
MQLSLDEQEFIRRAFHLEGKAIRQIERETGHSRQAIRNALSMQPPSLSSASSSSFREAPIFGPFQARVESLIAQNETLPRKQRYTAHRIFEIIADEGYQGCESRVRQHIAAWKEAHQTPEVFLPLEFEPGQDAQVDWGEAYVLLGGIRQKVQFFVMHLCYSRRTYAMCFPSQNQESFLFAHVAAFHHFEGVPHRISYDNLATAVKLVFDKTRKRSRSRQEVRAFTSFRSYYLFESHFCQVAKGNEKGGVEGSVGYTRRNFMVPLPTATSFDDLNRQVLERCLQEDARTVAREHKTIGEAWEQEKPLLLPLPSSDYDCCDMVTVRLTPYSQAQYETNRYSVPVKHARKTVTLKAYPLTVDIFDGTQKVASHARCYEREHDLFDPLHYLALLEKKPGAFEYARPLKKWRRDWPATYHQMLSTLKDLWPDGRGIQEFVRILMLHEHYEADQMERAIERALSYGCTHLDGVLYCLHELAGEAEAADPSATHPLDLSDRPDLDAIGTQPVDLSRYEHLLKLSW